MDTDPSALPADIDLTVVIGTGRNQDQQETIQTSGEIGYRLLYQTLDIDDSGLARERVTSVGYGLEDDAVTAGSLHQAHYTKLKRVRPAFRR